MSQRNVNSTGVSHWLIHCAARQAPQSFAQRLEEEWLADLAERPSAMSRLRLAIGCCWATQLVNLPTIMHPPAKPTVSAPNMQGTVIYAPKPIVYISRDPDPVTELTTGVDPQPIGPTPGSNPARRVHVQGGPGTGFPDPDDFYPGPAKYLGEQGVATVQVCVDAKGRLTSPPTTLQGTGSSRLDQGALKLATAGSGHYRATTEDGQPVNSCFPFRVRFQLRK